MTRATSSATKASSTVDDAWPALHVDSWKPTRDTVHGLERTYLAAATLGDWPVDENAP